MQNADVGRVTQRLINHAVAFGQSNQGGDLIFAGVSIQIELQSNLLKNRQAHLWRRREYHENRDRLQHESWRFVMECPEPWRLRLA